MTSEAIKQDVISSFKASTWDKFPDWAKDAEGRWGMTYRDSLAFIANTESTDGDYLVSVGIVLAGAASQMTVLSCAIANGSSLDDVQPGIDYFKELAEAGRLDTGDTSSARLTSGEMVCSVDNYDYSVLSWRDNIVAENPTIFSNRMVMLVCIYSISILPFVYQGIRNNLHGINVTQLLEAVELLGTGKFYAFVRIVLPSMLSGILVSSLLALSTVFGDFAIIAGNKFEIVQMLRDISDVSFFFHTGDHCAADPESDGSLWGEVHIWKM